MSKLPFILVASHERSGTHFLIDALRLNLKGTEFPFLRPSFPNLENLLLPHDKEVFEGFRRHASPRSGATPIFKTHLLPSEIDAALNTSGVLNDDEKIFINHVYQNSQLVYIHRDGRDVLVSLYHFMRQGGGMHVGLRNRLAELQFSDFLRMPNPHIHTIRSFQDFDKNVATYWIHHVQEWVSLINSKSGSTISYEDLNGNFSGTIRKIAYQLGREEDISDPVQLVPIRRTAQYPLLIRIARRMMVLNLSSKHLKSTAVAPRKGIVGDWKNHFNSSDRDFFMDNAGGAANKLGLLHE